MSKGTGEFKTIHCQPIFSYISSLVIAQNVPFS